MQRIQSMRRNARIAVGAMLAIASACAHETRTPSVEACTEILARRQPAARVVDVRTDAPSEVTLDFEIGDWWKRAQRGRLACSFEAQPNGGLRLLGASLDGVSFGPTERTLINADLLLADLRRAGAEAGARRD